MWYQARQTTVAAAKPLGSRNEKICAMISEGTFVTMGVEDGVRATDDLVHASRGVEEDEDVRRFVEEP